MFLDLIFLQTGEELGKELVDQSFPIITFVIGLVIPSIFWLIKEKKFDPEKWKKDSKKDTILQQIAAYGKLLIFLDSAEIRRKGFDREMPQVTKDSTHLFLFPGHDKQFNQLFRENLHLCSENIRRLHNQIIKNDEDYLFSEKKWPENQHSWIQAFDFSEIHSEIKKEYVNLKNEYKNLTDYSID